MTRRAAVGTVLALALFAQPAAAQIIRGAVVGRGGTVGVPGVVVLLVDSAGGIVGRTLSSDGGEYRLQAPGAGVYRLRTMRIGFRPDTSEAIAIGAGQERELPLVLAGVAVMLDTVRVAERSTCGSTETGDATAAVWEQVRTTLLAAQITARLRSVNATILTYERTLDPNTERVREQTAGVISGLTVRPWTSLLPDSLRRVGYVVAERDGSVSYFAPDLDVLLSSNFVVDHCFRVRRDRDTTLMGIAFEPTKERAKIAEIEGTLWLSRRTSELRRLEFRYVNVQREYADRAAGEMEFARMSNDGWAISRWGIKMPVLEVGNRVGAENALRVVELFAVGGELSYAVRGTDTLFARAPLTMSGTVEDSVTHAPIAGAQLSLAGTALTAVTDQKGRFSIRDVLPGEYTIEVTTDAYEAIKAKARWPFVFVDVRSQPAIRLVSARQIVEARTAVFSGVVVADSTETPIAGADVAFPSLEVMAITDDKGAFRIAAIQPGAHGVVVRRVGYGPMNATLTFAAGRTVDRRVVLTKLTVLDTVVVEARSDMAAFEENRKLGLGRFLTRADLEKLEGRPLGSTLMQVPDVGVLTGRGMKAWVASKRSTALVPGASGMWCPDPSERIMFNMRCACYARVYIDQFLMNPEQPARPFDVNTIPTEMIEAIEFYASATQAPLKYQARNAQCGVMVIHRRRTYKKRQNADSLPRPPS